MHGIDEIADRTGAICILRTIALIADGLLHPDPGGQRVFQLRDGLLELARIRRLAAETGGGLGLIGSKAGYDAAHGCDAFVMIGSDYPFNMGDTDPVGTLKKAGLDDETFVAIMQKNAERFLGLPPQ